MRCESSALAGEISEFVRRAIDRMSRHCFAVRRERGNETDYRILSVDRRVVGGARLLGGSRAALDLFGTYNNRGGERQWLEPLGVNYRQPHEPEIP
jgi:hypothetical protein